MNSENSREFSECCYCKEIGLKIVLILDDKIFL
jgi:hypothetical protein